MNTLDQEKSSKAIILATLGILILIAAVILFLSSPTSHLLGESQYAFRAAFHGLFAGIFMITVTVGLYQAYRLWSGIPLRFREMEIGSIINAAACFLTIVLGNWLYIPYRASGGPRSYFLEKMPEIHKIFFEFKEFTALFTFPLAVAVAYIICQYGENLIRHRKIREMLALLLVLTFFYFIIAFGLGAAVTKLMSV